MIPEAVMKPANAFWSFGEHSALCYSPFGIEDGADNFVFAQSYKVLNELMPLISEHQGSNRMIGVMKMPGESERTVTMGDYQLCIKYDAEDAYGLIIRTGKNEICCCLESISKFISLLPTKRKRVISSKYGKAVTIQTVSGKPPVCSTVTRLTTTLY